MGREQVREFARAIKCDDPACFDEEAAAELGYDSIVAPLTFVSIFAKLVQDDFFRNVDIGMETMQIVQVDQRFIYHKPMLCRRQALRPYGSPIGGRAFRRRHRRHQEHLHQRGMARWSWSAYTTLMGHEGDNSIQLRWDKESGQVVRTA